ncbi:MAG: hypothetical protein FWG90_05080 [Oscillospiraceae bacterium]|nr:hypothetical protein [Oscillospiraceae bacterium]
MRKTTTSAAVKRRYNEKTYQVYNFNVRKDGPLYQKLEEYKTNNPQGLSSLIKTLLEEHFKIEGG